jgi:hypothetical protein
MLLYTQAFGLPHPHMLTGAIKMQSSQKKLPPHPDSYRNFFDNTHDLLFLNETAAVRCAGAFIY